MCFSYLSIQGMTAFDAETESNIDVNINAGDPVAGWNQFVSQVL